MRYLILFFIISYVNVFGQVKDTIDVSFTKSAFILFDDEPFFQSGSEEIIVKPLDDNKLMIQAGVERFEETNLFVRVGSNMMMFIIRYTDNPVKFIYDERSVVKNNVSDKQVGEVKTVTSGVPDENIIVDVVKKQKDIQNAQKVDSLKKFHDNNILYIINKPRSIKDRGVVSGKIQFYAKNLYVFDNYFYLDLVIDNRSKIKYEIDFIRFRIDNIKKGIKKAADQYIEINPLYVYNDSIMTVPPKSKVEKVFVFSKFTIDDNKQLLVEMWELNGDRKLFFSFKSEDILTLKSINE